MGYKEDDPDHFSLQSLAHKAGGVNIKVLRTKTVVERVGLCRSHLWRLERDGQFPRKIRLGPNSIGYVESEIDEWIAARIAERDDQDSKNRG